MPNKQLHVPYNAWNRNAILIEATEFGAINSALLIAELVNLAYHPGKIRRL